MKMRKLISLCGALAIAATAFSSIASAAITTETITLNTKVTPVTDEMFMEYYDEVVPEGKDAYIVDFSLSGFADELAYTKDGGTNAKPKLTGFCVNGFEVVLETENAKGFATIDQDYSYFNEWTTADEPSNIFGNNLWSTSNSSEFFYPSAKDVPGTVDGATDSLCSMWFVIGEGEEITFDITKAEVNMFEYKQSGVEDQVDFKSLNSTLVLASETVTLAPEGEPDPEPEADPVTAELKESNANGYIWYVEVADEMDAFGAKFYAGDKTAEREIRNMDALPKLDGDVAYKFNVGLKLNTIDSIDKAEFTANGFTATWPEVE